MKRILITGSRDWTDYKPIIKALADVQDTDDSPVLVTGACPTGADQIAEEIWTAWGLPVERHPADWNTHGKAAGPIRNQHMVDLGADLCLAFRKGNSRGTTHCMEAAAKAGIPVHLVEEAGPL